MKNNRIRGYVGRLAGVVAGGILAITGFKANAAHELIYAVDLAQGTLLHSFYSDAPGTILSSLTVSGLQPTEVLRGIDYQNGALYAVGSLSRLYTINLTTLAATQVGSPFSTLLNGSSFGVDASTTTMRVVSNLRQNLSIDLVSGVATVLPNVNPGTPNTTALAFRPGANAPTNWIAGDSLANNFNSFVPSSGLIGAIGAAGIDFSRDNGFDISVFSGIAYLGSPAASSDTQANLYTVNLATGAVTLVGQIGNPGDNILMGGLTVVPEPSAVAVAVFGGLLLLVFRRRR